MLDELADAFADLMDFVDRGVSTMLKSSAAPTNVFSPPPPYVSLRGVRPASATKSKSSPKKWHAPLSSSTRPCSTRSNSNPYLPKRIPFQKKCNLQPRRKTPASQSKSLLKAVTTTKAVQERGSPRQSEKAKVPTRPAVHRVNPPTLVKAPMPSKNNGLLFSEVQCDASRYDILVVAIADLETCKEVFGGWSAQFNLVQTKRKDKTEQNIVTAVDNLNRDTSAALHSSYAILSSYRTLTRLMDKQLDTISRSQSGGGELFGGLGRAEIRRLTSSVTIHSKVLSERVRKIQERLSTLVHDIEKTKERATSKALRRKIWHWFVRVFRALSVLISAGGTIFTLVNPLGLVGSVGIAAASTLAAAVAKICEIVENKFSETTFDSILRLLRSQIPVSAKAAEMSLTSFQACHRILQLELQIQSGQKSAWIASGEAQRAHGSWKAAHERLRSVDR